jgi:site-specific DNA recombinase
MLANEAYTGTAYYNKCEGHGNGRQRDRSQWIPVKVPAIIDPQSFGLTQEIRKSRRRTMVKKRVYILSGLLRCTYCGSRYSGSWHSGSYGYYRCMNFAKMRPLPKTCRARAVRADRIEAAVIEAVKAALSDPAVMKRSLLGMLERAREKAKGAVQERARVINRRMLLEQKRKRLLDLYLDGGVSKGEYADKQAEILEKTKELDRLLEEVSREIPHIDESRILGSVGHFLAQARERLGNFTPETTQAFMRFLFDDVVYDWKERLVRLKGNLPITSGDEISFHFSGVTTPAMSDKNLLKFELNVSV